MVNTSKGGHHLKGDKLRKIREYRGYSQQSLADALDVNRPYINLIENGHRTPSLQFLERIADELKCSIKDFF